MDNIYESGTVKIGPNKFENLKFHNLEFISELGHGVSGRVIKCIFNNNVMAVKIIPRKNHDKEKGGYMDLEVLKHANSPFIVKYYGYIFEFHYLYICMEEMKISLEKLYKNYLAPKNLKFPESGKITLSILQALNYLQKELKIIHRDIKPSNILMDIRGTIKLCDFDVAANLNDPLAMSIPAGTIAYSAPEKLEGKQYDDRSDTWSLGITLIELASLEYPYKYESEFELILIIIQDSPKIPENYSIDFQHFLKQCIDKNVSCRPNFDTLLNSPWCQVHKYFNEYDDSWITEILNT